MGSVLNVEITTKTETSDDGEVALTKLVTYTKTPYDANGTPIEIPVLEGLSAGSLRNRWLPQTFFLFQNAQLVQLLPAAVGHDKDR